MARLPRSRAPLLLALLALLAACLRGDPAGPRGAGVAAPLADASGPAAIEPAAAPLDTTGPAAVDRSAAEEHADPSPDRTSPDSDLAPPRQHHLPPLVGARRDRVRELTGEPGIDGEAGWVHHGPDLTLRYEDGRAIELIARVPAAHECAEAARWLGFVDAMAPLRRGDRCLWPGVSERHRLAPGLAGEHVFATATFHVWRARAPARSR